MKIITATERLAAKAGVKLLLLGASGAGKTYQLRHLDPDRTLFVDLEAGDLAIGDWPGRSARPETWDECRRLAVYLAGPDRNAPAASPYSERAYYEACAAFEDVLPLDGVDTFFVDSLTVAGRLSLAAAMQSDEARTKGGAVDKRAAYGLHGQEMIAWITRLQHARGKNVVFCAILDRMVDDLGRAEFVPQIDGSKAGRELPGIVDEVITLAFVPFDDAETPVRAFITDAGNAWGYPAKDRSGALEPIEKPHLGELIAKIEAARGQIAKPAPRAADHSHQEMKEAIHVV